MSAAALRSAPGKPDQGRADYDGPQDRYRWPHQKAQDESTVNARCEPARLCPFPQCGQPAACGGAKQKRCRQGELRIQQSSCEYAAEAYDQRGSDQNGTLSPVSANRAGI